jgi:hypothetical protein
MDEINCRMNLIIYRCISEIHVWAGHWVNFTQSMNITEGELPTSLIVCGKGGTHATLMCPYNTGRSMRPDLLIGLTKIIDECWAFDKGDGARG